MIKFPYGRRDFKELITENYLYVDCQKLTQKYREALNLCCYAVVSVGFDQILWEEV